MAIEIGRKIRQGAKTVNTTFTTREKVVGTIGLVLGGTLALVGGSGMLDKTDIQLELNGTKTTYTPIVPRDPKLGEFDPESGNIVPEIVEGKPVWSCGEGGPTNVIKVTINSSDWSTHNPALPEVRTASAAQRLSGSTSPRICHVPNKTEWGHVHTGLTGLNTVFNGEVLEFEAPQFPVPTPTPNPIPAAIK